AALLAAMLVLLVYLSTMAPTVFPLDSAELTVAAYSLGLVHAPGYPVYLLIAHLFTYLPLGDVAYRVNLLSAVATSGSVMLLILLLQQLTGRIWPALVAGLSFAFSFYVWSLSLVAEVYTLQVCFLAVMLLSVWHWRAQGSQRALLMMVGMMGLAVVNNPATTLWWPGLLLLAASTPHRRDLSWRDLVKLAAVFALGLTPLFYLPLRSAAHPQYTYVGYYDAAGIFHTTDLTQLSNLLWYLSGGPFSGMIAGYSRQELWRESADFLHRLWATFLGIGLPLGLWGLWRLGLRRRMLALGLLLTALPHAIFFIAYRAPDKETMFLPVYLIWAIFLGVGIAHLRPIVPRSLSYVKVLLPLALLLVNMPYVDVSEWHDPRQEAETRLRTAKPDALYMAVWGDAAAMEYLQLTNGLRSDVTVVNTFLTSPSVRQDLVRNALQAKRPVYITFSDPILLGQYNFMSVDEGFQLRPKRR
ncbi:MAG: DUF2723 domain-containing protein, partial [Ardenticatenaceae bacterium]